MIFTSNFSCLQLDFLQALSFCGYVLTGDIFHEYHFSYITQLLE